MAWQFQKWKSIWERYVLLPTAQDHKRLNEKDKAIYDKLDKEIKFG